jgi:putative heme iron utilization protein
MRVIYTLPQDCIAGFDAEAFDEINEQFCGRITTTETKEGLTFVVPDDMPTDVGLSAGALLEHAFCLL